MKPIFFLLLWAIGSAHADSFEKRVSLRCDTERDELIVNYAVAPYAGGKSTLGDMAWNQWNPWDLVTVQSGQSSPESSWIAATRTVTPICALSDGTYSVKFGPKPGNFNLQGRCGAWMSAWVHITRGDQSIYGPADFEEGVGCRYDQGEVVTQVKVTPHALAPKITKRSASQIFSAD